MLKIRCQLALSILVVSALSAAVGAHAQVNSGETAVRATTVKFFAAFERKDVDGVMALWIDKPLDRDTFKQYLHDTFARVGEIREKNLIFDKFETAGDSVIANVTVEIDAVDPKTSRLAEGFGSVHRALFLDHEPAGWKISRYLTMEEYLASRIAAAKSFKDRRALLEANKNLVNPKFGKALSREGSNFALRAEYPQAESIFELLKEVALKTNDRMSLAAAVHGVASVYNFQGRHAEALGLYEQALKIREEIGDKAGVGLSLTAIGVVHGEMGDNLGALEYYTKSLAISEELADKASIAKLMVSIGSAYYSLGDCDKALEYYQKCQAILEELDDKQSGVLGLMGIGMAQSSKGNYLQAMQFYRKALMLAKELDLRSVIGTTLLSMGECHLEQGNRTRALVCFEEGLTISEEIGEKGLEQWA
ncbi:MAG: tetratricopeptide repeat protein, partial [Blastocatellia bacterium]